MQQPEIKSFKDLVVWQKAMDLAEECYLISDKLPKREMFGLSSQIQRSATSVPSNIAEGNGRDHVAEYIHHLSIARGSLSELETQLLLAQRLRYVTAMELQCALSLIAEVGRMLTALKRSLAKWATKRSALRRA